MLLSLLFGFIIYVLIHFNGLYGQDAHEYFFRANQIREILFGDTHLAITGQKISLAYPSMGAIIGMVLPLPLGMQLLNIFFYLFTLIFTALLVSRIYGLPAYHKPVIIYVLLILGFMPYMLRASYTVMTDISVGFFIVLSYWAVARCQKIRLFNLGILFFSVLGALIIRPQVLPILVPLAIYVLYLLAIKEKKYVLLLVVASLLSVVVLLINLYSYNLWSIVTENEFLRHWHLSNFYRSIIYLNGEEYTRSFPNIVFYAGALFKFPFFGICVFLIPFVSFRLWRHPLLLVAIVGILLYVVMLCGLAFQNHRMLVVVMPMVCVLFFSGFHYIYNRMVNKPFWLAFLFFNMFIAQSFFCLTAFKEVRAYNQSEIRVVESLNSLIKELAIPNLSKIYTLGLEGPLRSYSNMEVVSLWDYSPSPQAIDRGSFVVYNPEQVENTLSDSPVCAHIANSLTNIKLSELLSFDNGFVLYLVE